jgi:maltooligosyltrehalose trehalohydrolase
MRRDLGAIWLRDGRCRFRVWAPLSEQVQLHVLSPEDRVVPMQTQTRGYHQVVLDDVVPGTWYRYRLASGRERPDPASGFQPEGVHGPSEIGERGFPWEDRHWHGIPMEDYILYEIHVGTFTPDGTFDSIIRQLDTLIHLGITALELMPVGEFPGNRNWGYDGAYLFAPKSSYGGPQALKRLINACHKRDLAVVLDVVYNHLGPEGNYLPEFGHYFTDRYKTPWGRAVNFDDAHCDEVRHFLIENALYWITEFHVDALRLDAVHAILDHSALNFLEELAQAVHERATVLNRRVHAIAESALNDTRLIRSTELGGYGLDAQWNDDFHHSLHTLLTKESSGYYVDFGDFQHMAQAFSEGFVYSGRYSKNRQRRHGNSSRIIAPVKFVVYAQNHDQIGNRMLGERLSQLVSFEWLKLAAGAVLLSPFVPLLFMGDEYGEPAPFQYFVSHSQPELVEAVRRGRIREFANFNWAGTPPDPQDEATFQRSKLKLELVQIQPHRTLFDFHRELIRLRKTLPALAYLSKDNMDVTSFTDECVLMVRRWYDFNEVITLLNFNNRSVQLTGKLPTGSWRKKIDSEDERWMGNGITVPESFDATLDATLLLRPAAVVLLQREIEA